MGTRVWKEVISPAQLHKEFGVYKGIWMPQMDRCWMSDDGIQVTSRLLNTEWGKVEHAAITVPGTLSCNGEYELPWSVKQGIKNELFGENRLAIEVYPKQRNLVDVMDVYHLWVFPKGFDLPFGIHPTRDKQARWINRGVPKNASRLAENSQEMLKLIKSDPER